MGKYVAAFTDGNIFTTCTAGTNRVVLWVRRDGSWVAYDGREDVATDADMRTAMGVHPKRDHRQPGRAGARTWGRATAARPFTWTLDRNNHRDNLEKKAS